MGDHRRFSQHVSVVLLFLVVGGLGIDPAAGEEGDRQCPLCGHKGMTFENSPEGLLSKLRFALATKDIDLMKECLPDEEEEALEHTWQDEEFWYTCKLMSCKVDGDRAVLEISRGDARVWRYTVVRREGNWQFDDELARQAESIQKTRDCSNNLKQVGLFLVMYVSKFGSDQVYPEPGELLTTLFTLPTPVQAVGAGCELLLPCRESDETNTPESVSKRDPAATSYESIVLPISNGTPPGSPIVWDKKPCHIGMRNVLFFDGHVETLAEDEFQRRARRCGSGRYSRLRMTAAVTSMIALASLDLITPCSPTMSTWHSVAAAWIARESRPFARTRRSQYSGSDRVSLRRAISRYSGIWANTCAVSTAPAVVALAQSP